MSSLALELRGITKRFGGMTALDDATLLIRGGTVHAVLGENGAGKTTLMRVAFGMVRPDAGSVRIDGKQVVLRSPADAISAGIGMVHQHFALVPTMTVAENVALGAHGRYSARAAAEDVRRIGEWSGLSLDPTALAGELPVGAQQRLEIVKALSRDARILILDEPTAVLAPAEVTDLLARLRSFADEGRTVVLITHKLREALSIADEVTVLRRGAIVLSAPSLAASESLLAGAILGDGPNAAALSGEELGLLAGASITAGSVRREGTDEAVEQGHRGLSTNSFVQDDEPGSTPETAAPPPSESPMLEVRGLSVTDARGTVKIRDASFVVHRGEIVGIAGVEGAGHHELLRALAGRIDATAGFLSRAGDAGFVPEDRHGDALILDFSMTENVVLRNAGSQRGTIDWAGAASRADNMIRQFDVRAASSRVPVSTLSGGNQQKLVLARELEDGPAVLIAENPTRGLDIQASAMIHSRLRAAAAAGTAVVIHSSDLDELLALSTRILVVFGGAVHEVSHDREAIGRGMLGLFTPTPQ